MEQQNHEMYTWMTEAPIEPLILKLAIPCIISMLVTAFYNMTDTFFVGFLNNTSITGAIGVAFSVMAIIQAVGFFFGQGSGTYISRELGKQNHAEASKMAATGFALSVLLGVGMGACGLLFLTPLGRLIGATDTILPYVTEYLRIILLGTPWMMGALTLNNQLRHQGRAVYGMIGITAGALINMVLDPLLIFVFDMGISGAAWATIIGQLFSFSLLLLETRKGINLRIRCRNIHITWTYLAAITKGGFPSLGRQGLAAIAAICLNLAAKESGDAAIAAMGIVQRIIMFSGSAMIGFGQGFQPFCGFNYGAKCYRRIRQGFWFCVKETTGFLLAVSIVLFLFAPQLVSAFRDDPAVVAFGVTALRVQAAVMFTHGYSTISGMMLQTMGRTLPATFLSMARQGLFLIPIVLILPGCIGELGIQISQPVSDLVSLLCAVPIQQSVLRELAREECRDPAKP